MKIKHLLTLTFICLLTLSTNAQKRFILENKGAVVNTRIFDNLDSAVAAIQTDDILYIPGGNFSTSNMVIDKNGAEIIGAGHHPDSTTATERTYLSGNITVNANHVSISGIYLSGDISVDGVASNPMITGFALKNSNVRYIYLKSSAGNPETVLSVISNNVIREEIQGGNTASAFISHNIVEDQVRDFDGSGVYFSYNIFLFSGSCSNAYSLKPIDDVSGATFERNIFRSSTSGSSYPYTWNFCSLTSSSGNLTFNHNAVSNSTSTSIPQSVTYGSNIFNNTLDLPTFIGGSLPSSFNYTFDFHHSGGDIGIYGGSGYSPIPRNPHIKTAEISDQTDNNGNLQIIFEVEAKQ